MGHKKNYFLVARSRKTNNYTIVPINGKRGNSLEDIDLYTTLFPNQTKLELELNKEGIVEGRNIDFFIASQSRIKGTTHLKTQELLYQPSGYIRGIADYSRHNQLERGIFIIDNILDSFATCMKNDFGFREQVISGKTNIYEKYVKYFENNPTKIKSIKLRNHSWARSSYVLIRDVVEAMARSTSKYKDMSDQMYREILAGELLRETDPDYVPNQISFYNSYQSGPSYDEDKLVEVMSTIENLPSDTFYNNQDEVEFNQGVFYKYNEDDLKKFQTILPKDIRLIIQLFLSQRDALENVCDNHVAILQNGIKNSQKQLIKLLKNNHELLDIVYAWCELYNSYELEMLGDYPGKRYRKDKRN